MNQNSAFSLRAACSKVLGILEGWEEIDVTSIDVEDVVRRFNNLHARDFTPSSLDAYGKRFRNALESFLDYTRDPGAWKPSARPARNRTGEPNGQKGTASKSGKRAAPETPDRYSGDPTPVPTTAVHGLIEYPFPIREGATARLMLPRDLNVAEAKRVYAFMRTLAIDYEPSDG